MPEEGWDFSLEAYTGLDGIVENSGPIDGLTAPRPSPLRRNSLEELAWVKSCVLPPSRLDFLSPALLG